MELSHLGKRVGVTHRPSIEKAKEYQRLLGLKMPTTGPLGMSAEARSVCCIDLGCRFHQQSIDSALALKYSLCKTPAAYSKAITSIQHTLGLNSLISTKELCVQFGCLQANELAKRVLQTYRDTMSGAAAAVTSAAEAAAGSGAVVVTTGTIPLALLNSRSVYPCAAFYLSCRLLKLAGVDRKRLLVSAQATEKEFANVIESFKQVMPELRPKEPVPAAKKRKAKGAAAAADEDAAATGVRPEDGFADDDEESSALFDERETDLDDAALNPSLMHSSAVEHALWKRRVEAEARSDALQMPAGKKRKTDSLATTSASPDDSAAAGSSQLRQAKLNFGGATASAASSSGRQLRVEDEDEGEAEL